MIFIIKTESQQKSDKAKISATTSPASATYTKKLSFSKPQLTTDRYEGTIEWGAKIVSLSTIDKNPKDRFKNLHFFLKFRIFFWKRIQISNFLSLFDEVNIWEPCWISTSSASWPRSMNYDKISKFFWSLNLSFLFFYFKRV